MEFNSHADVYYPSYELVRNYRQELRWVTLHLNTLLIESIYGTHALFAAHFNITA